MYVMADDLRSWIGEHTAETVAIGIGVIFLVLLALTVVSIIDGGQMSRSIGEDAAITSQSARLSGEAGAADGGGGGAFVEVQEAQFDIDSADADADADQIRSQVETYNGYVEESQKRESSLYRTISLTVRVPDDQFESVIDGLQDEYDVDSYDTQNYRVSIQRAIDELTVLNRTMADYEELRAEINQMNTDEEKISLLMDLTENELDLAEKQKRYERELSEKQQRGDEATIHVTLRERTSVDIWPENLKNRFMSNVKDMLNSITEIVLGTATTAVVLFFKAVQILVYLIVVLLPVFLVYKAGRWIYERYEE